MNILGEELDDCDLGDYKPCENEELDHFAVQVCKSGENRANPLLLLIARFAVRLIARSIRRELRLKAYVSVSIQILPRGILYRMRLEVEAKINGIWVAQIYEIVVFVPHFGRWVLRSFKLVQPN